MSKMPGKKRSCFQITSVTQAQVAASSITDDTESLDDPDESRTEDVSSEIFDVSRADYDPEVCDISSSEETLNNVSESETTSAITKSHIPQDVHVAAVSNPANGGLAYRPAAGVHANAHVGGGGVPPTTFAASTQQPTAAVASQSNSTPQAPAAAPSSTTTSCSSRFRVIKLDHGTGEPFKRGRWTCTEFYDKESSESSASRTVDSSKHLVTLDHNADNRDTSSSVATHSESASESGYVSAPPGEVQAQSYGISHQGFGGASQTLVAPGHNGVQQMLPNSSMHMVKSPVMPPSSQPQQFPYSPQQQQQHPASHSFQPAMPPSQPDYRQQQQPAATPQPSGAAAAASTATHTLPVASLPVGAPLNHQGPSPVMTPAGVPVHHILGLLTGVGDAAVPSSGGSLSSGQAASAQGLPLQQSAAGAAAAGVVGLLQGGVGVHPSQPSGQTMPSAVVAAAAAAAAALSGMSSGNPSAPQTLPTQALVAAAGGVGIQSPPQGSRTGMGLPQSEDARRKSDALPQLPPGMAGKDPSGLSIGTPAVNSLFGIPIGVMDGDDDSASGASVVAIDNKIEQAMDLVKSHLMYAVREEVEVLKEQIKELYERNSQLERENAVLKSLANSDQLSQLPPATAATTQTSTTSPPGSASHPQQQQQQPHQPAPPQQQQQHPPSSSAEQPSPSPPQPHNLSSA
ncbi:TSC22 domain family protein 2-like isoform X2 [Engraulis encrasicolus]|uniref:TSC22 domain family protein 2-like isoform X2 n=1 Tax=Engraulis encrasicolus TaxID=184585 RepID=UPI002FD1B441